MDAMFLVQGISSNLLRGDVSLPDARGGKELSCHPLLSLGNSEERKSVDDDVVSARLRPPLVLTADDLLRDDKLIRSMCETHTYTLCLHILYLPVSATTVRSYEVWEQNYENSVNYCVPFE